MTDTRPQNFWRGFTWKRFLKYSACILLYTMLSEVLFDHKNWSYHFHPDRFISRAIISIVIGFVFAVWYEPVVKQKH